MLQQILKDMYIAPELLAELDETQKQTLFCRMREEQVRRWRIWDEKQMEMIKTMPPPVPEQTDNKKVHFLVDDEDEPLLIYINQYEEYYSSDNDHHNDHVIDDYDSASRSSNWTEQNCKPVVTDNNCVIMSENETQTNKRIPMEEDCTDFKKSEPAPQFIASPQNAIVKNTEKSTENRLYIRQPSVSVKYQDKRALKELSLNKKVQNVAKRVAEWEQRTTEQTASPIDVKMRNMKKEPQPEVNETEAKEDQIWREQQKKAKEVECRIRTIARRAREEHRRSLLEVNNNEEMQASYINFLQSGVISKCPSAVTTVTSAAVCKPPANRESIISWFKSKEIGRNAGFDVDRNTIAPWFHGLITSQEAELLLNDEPAGAFLVRISEKNWGYVISYKDISCCEHFLIDASNGAYQLLGIEAIKHKTLNELIQYHNSQPITITGNEILHYSCVRKSDISDLFEVSN